MAAALQINGLVSIWLGPQVLDWIYELVGMKLNESNISTMSNTLIVNFVFLTKERYKETILLLFFCKV